MRSATVPTDDRTARARIRSAALARFAVDGTASASVRAIAADAGVSPALVMHHYGSKEALRGACDAYVAQTIRQRKQAAMSGGASFDPAAALRQAQDSAPLLRYLARTIAEGSPQAAALVDEMVADAAEYMTQGVDSGLLRPTDDPYGRAAVLTLWSLGALVLHEHVHRLLGVDLTGSDADLASATAYFAPALELLSGLLTPQAASRWRDAFGGAAAPAASDRKETRR